MLPWARIVGTLLWGSGLFLIAPGATGAQQAVDPAILEIVAIRASKDAGSLDPRLEPMMGDLRSLPYVSFTLIGARACTVNTGDRCGMKVAQDSYLVVRAVENAQRYLRLNVLLNRKNRPVFDANLKIDRNAGVVLTNTHREGPAVVMSIKVKERPQNLASPPTR
jgi:hypothetical protein